MVVADIAGYKLRTIFENFAEWRKKNPSTVDLKDMVQKTVSPKQPVDEKSEQEPSKTDQTKLKVVAIEPPWNQLFDDVIGKYDFIYHSDTCRKLKEIANR